MTKWEYCLVIVEAAKDDDSQITPARFRIQTRKGEEIVEAGPSSTIIDVLNRLGADAWEEVSHTTFPPTHLLKRALEAAPSAPEKKEVSDEDVAIVKEMTEKIRARKEAEEKSRS